MVLTGWGFLQYSVFNIFRGNGWGFIKCWARSPDLTQLKVYLRDYPKSQLQTSFLLNNTQFFTQYNMVHETYGKFDADFKKYFFFIGVYF